MTTGEHYRGIASLIRAAVRVFGLAECRGSLFNLATTYEEVALRIEASELSEKQPRDREAQAA